MDDAGSEAEECEGNGTDGGQERGQGKEGKGKEREVQVDNSVSEREKGMKVWKGKEKEGEVDNSVHESPRKKGMEVWRDIIERQQRRRGGKR